MLWDWFRRKTGGPILGAPADEGNSDGARAEQLAADFLRSQGLRILARNVRCKGGEVDIVAEHAGCIVFAEVRLRGNARFGGAAASITSGKQARVILAAQRWLAGEGQPHARKPCRFDAVLLDSLDEARIEWLQAAFSY